MAIIGAILGDISGSQFEFDRPSGRAYKTCPLFSEKCMYTDDTVMTLAVKSAIDNGLGYAEEMRRIGQMHPDCGYGGMFADWVLSPKPLPAYGSFGNGAAMRVSYIGEHFGSAAKVAEEAKKSAIVSHDHPEGVKGAEVAALCVWMAKNGASKKEIYDMVLERYPGDSYRYPVSMPLRVLRRSYAWSATCMDSVPVAMRCFYESEDYASFLRNVFSLDCDADTICAIGGGVAEEYYHGTGLDDQDILRAYLDGGLLEIAGAG